MKIDNQLLQNIHTVSSHLHSEDLFDLDLSVTEIKFEPKTFSHLTDSCTNHGNLSGTSQCCR